MPDQISVKVFRYDPSGDDPPRYDTYTVPNKPGMVVGDALEYIYENMDSTLAFRYECRTRQCGSCLIQVDGEPRLTCKEPLGERSEVLLEPLGTLPIVRDLVTDRTSLLGPLYDLEPFPVPAAREFNGERPQPEPIPVQSMEWVKMAEECAECTLCTDVCPAYLSTQYAGPMLFNKLARLAFHPNDDVDRRKEAWQLMIHYCKTCFRCEEICPHQLPIRQFSISRLLGNSRSYKAFRMAEGGES